MNATKGPPAECKRCGRIVKCEACGSDLRLGIDIDWPGAGGVARCGPCTEIEDPALGRASVMCFACCDGFDRADDEADAAQGIRRIY